MGSPEGAKYSTDEIITCMSTLAQLQRRTKDILELAIDADPDWYTWGVIGIPFAVWYGNTADDVYRHLSMIGECLKNKVDALDCVSQSYRALEEGISRAMEKIEEMLDSGPFIG
ncbi:hypothetical protein DFJ64_2153 [Thermasporomyces composti]|jgi:hypothetical protein|uniref:Excreted virulence factor EspC (Type VII ESX diderm) n=2 Tax=Thermasporomyces composti TaxID=696763 RepID=A0A3D9V4Q5_THECX|nr:hypothetical protein DFJ64_2153 [Thermasporomyces composti]